MYEFWCDYIILCDCDCIKVSVQSKTMLHGYR